VERRGAGARARRVARPSSLFPLGSLLYFASELSTYITGTTIAIDGGMTRTIF
jgi:NAD(P)-dependent dehydrogenase (short-subunit alcohol dehydrogenase family)